MYLGKNKMINHKIISRWDLHPRIKAIKKKPKTSKELRDSIFSNSLISKSNCPSYGDSTINTINKEIKYELINLNNNHSYSLNNFDFSRSGFSKYGRDLESLLK